jgi:hypothetical protein
MSSTRKSRPPDKGAPAAHKPSHKVALNDVLRSLQDLVQNELTVETGKPGTETSPAPAHDVPPDADVAQTATPPRKQATPRARRSPAPGMTSPPIPPEGLQQDLPYFDSPAEPSAAPAIPVTVTLTDSPSPDGDVMPPATDALPAPGLRDTNPDGNALPALAPVVAADPAAGSDQATEYSFSAGLPETFPAATEDGELMDIPVLEDAVELADALGAPEMHTSLPAAAEARRLVIQAAARLNVDLRKEGKPGLSSDVIARLVRLLTEALAKAGANIDNSPSEKH